MKSQEGPRPKDHDQSIVVHSPDRSRSLRVRIITKPIKGPEPFDAEKDWRSWLTVMDAKIPGPLEATRYKLPRPTKRALKALEQASGRDLPGDSTDRVLLAAFATSHWGKPSILMSGSVSFFWDRFILALNRYPHRHSTAVKWLVPALRNLDAKSRETPDELWGEWERESRRVFNLTLHGHAPKFQGKKPPPTLLDYEDRSLSPSASRTALDDWRIQAHLLSIPGSIDFRSNEWETQVGLLDSKRLKALSSLIVEAAQGFWGPYETEAISSSLRRFLYRGVLDSRFSLTERRRMKSALNQMYRSFQAGLIKPARLHLTREHVEEYDWLLHEVQEIWRATKGLDLGVRDRRRRERVLGLLWENLQKELPRQLHNTDLGDCPAREVAAVLLSVRNGLGIEHPQTIFEALVPPRMAMRAEDPKKSAKPRRGRPRKKPDI